MSEQPTNPGQPNVNEPTTENQEHIKEIAGGIKNALERGGNLESATNSFVNGGYELNDVQAALKFLNLDQTQQQPQTPQQVPAAQPQIPVQPAAQPAAQPAIQQQVPAAQPQIQVQPQTGYQQQVQSVPNQTQQQPLQTPQQVPIGQPAIQQQTIQPQTSGQVAQQPQTPLQTPQQVPVAQPTMQPQVDQRPPMEHVVPVKKNKKSFFGRKNKSVVSHGSHKAKKAAMQKGSQLPLMGQKPKEVPKWVIIVLIVLGILLIAAAGFLGVYWTQLNSPLGS